MDNLEKNVMEQTQAKAEWQAPEVKEYDATREIQGGTLLGTDVLVLGGS